MKRLILVVLVFCGLVASAQTRADCDMKGMWVAGGNLGLGATSFILSANVAPQIGKRLTDDLECGIRLSYTVNHYFKTDYYEPYTANYFGGSVYLNYEIFNVLFLHVEDEALYKMMFYNKSYVADESKWYNSLFVGGGYRQYAGPNSFIQLSVLWNLNDYYNPITGDSSPYTNPVLRIGYFFAF